MELQTLTASKRDDKGTGPARRARQDGFIPGVVYGGDAEPLMIQVELREFSRLIHGKGGEHAIVQLNIAEQPSLGGPALLKEVQHHPHRGHILHADFQRISLDERISTVVPIVLEGRAPGVAEGGVLDHILRELEVECRALEVPESITVDVSELAINDSILVESLVVPSNVTVVTPGDHMVVVVHPPRVEQAVEAEAEAAEPEVIGQKKDEE